MEDLSVFAISIFSFVFVVNSPGNAFLYGGPIRFCHHHFSFYFCCDFSSKWTFVWRTSPFSSSLFFVLFSLWQLLEKALLSVFVIAIFCFLFVVAILEMLYHMENLSVFLIAVFVTSPGNALLYRGPSCFSLYCFFSCDFSWKCIFEWKTSPFLSSLFLFCVFVVNPPGNAFFYGGLSVFAIENFCFVLFLTWLLLEMLYCMENLSVFLIAVFLVLLLLECTFVWRTSLLSSSLFFCFSFFPDFSSKCTFVQKALRFPQDCVCVLFWCEYS